MSYVGTGKAGPNDDRPNAELPDLMIERFGLAVNRVFRVPNTYP